MLILVFLYMNSLYTFFSNLKHKRECCMYILKVIPTLILFISFAVADDFGNFDTFFQSNNGNLATLNSFLSSGVDPNSTDKTGHTLLQTAILNENTEAVRLILSYGADVNIDFPTVRTNGKPSQSIPVLIKITDRAFHIPLEMVELLLQNGLNTAVTDNKENTALIRVIYLLNQWSDRSYRNEFIKFLIRYRVPINAQNHNRDTALHIASKMGDLKTVRVLTGVNARLDLTNNQGMTPVQLAKFMSGNIPPTKADLRWGWYFSFFGKQYKIIRLLQEAEKQNGSTVQGNPGQSCRRPFI